MHLEPSPNTYEGRSHPLDSEGAGDHVASKKPDYAEKRVQEIRDHTRASELESDAQKRQRWYEIEAPQRRDEIFSNLATKSVSWFKYGQEK